MALMKDEYVIRKTSTSLVSATMTTIRNTYLDPKQDIASNKTLTGAYINYYFADLFDARDGSVYRIWSTGATNSTSIIAGNAANGDSYFNLIKMTDFVKETALAPYALKTDLVPYTLRTELDPYALKTQLSDLTNYRVESEIIQIVDTKINQIQIDEVIIG